MVGGVSQLVRVEWGPRDTATTCSETSRSVRASCTSLLLTQMAIFDPYLGIGANMFSGSWPGGSAFTIFLVGAVANGLVRVTLVDS